jgi:hypothetical protein
MLLRLPAATGSCHPRRQHNPREQCTRLVPVPPACLQTVEKAARATVSGSKRASARLAAGRGRGGVLCGSGMLLGKGRRYTCNYWQAPEATRPCLGACVERGAGCCHSPALSTRTPRL